MTGDYDRPSEMTYRHYKENVILHAEVTLKQMEAYPEDFDNLHDAVRQSIQGDPLVMNNGYQLMTILQSDTHPDTPDYCEPWAHYVDFSGNDTTASDCLTQMAYVCYYSDVFEKVKRLQEEDDD